MGFFLNRETAIRNYIETNIGEYLEEELAKPFDAFINDFLDLDKYKHPKCLFYNFGNYDLSPNSNESESGNFVFDIFLVFRQDTPEALHQEMVQTVDAFYNMIRGDIGFNLGGAVDIINNISVDFYNAGEGNPNLKIAAITFNTTTES